MIRLLVVEDSKLMREAIVGMLALDSNIEVVAQAENGEEALHAIKEYQPDVITLDISMPVMDGITALKHIMIKHPIPTVMLSSLTQEGARIAFDALRIGAVDFISKPSTVQDSDLSVKEAEIRDKIHLAASVEMGAIRNIRQSNKMLNNAQSNIEVGIPQRVVAIGASQGGYGALLKVIPHLEMNADDSYIVTLYAPSEHIDAFISYLNNFSAVLVKRAAYNEVLRPGVCYINAGTDYVTVHEQGDDYVLHVSEAPFASRKGAIDMMMFSVGDMFAENSVAVILSGLGKDGTEGMEEVVHRGGKAIVQMPASCLYKSMVDNAIALNPGAHIVADADIAAAIRTV